MKAILILAAVVLAGCANLPAGVQMSDEEKSACEAAGCTVWTRAELEKLVGIAMQRGYQAGRQSKGQSL